VAVVLLPGAVLHSADTRTGLALILQCVVVVHTGCALAWVLAGPAVRLMAFGFWLFSYVWLGLAPLAMLATDTYPLGFVVGQGSATTACAVVETGLLAYSAGAAAAGFRRHRRSVVLEPLLARRPAPSRVLLLGVLALLLAVVLIPQQGGIEPFFTSRQAVNGPTGASGGSGGDSAVRALAAWSLSAPAFWALLALLHVQRRRGGDQLLRGLRWALLPPLVALNAVVNNPISQPRFWAGTVVLTLLFGIPALRRPRGFRIAAAAMVTVVLVVFPYGDHFRNEERERVQLRSLAEQFTTNGDYDAYQQLQTGISLRQESGYAPETVLGPPLFFVPRATWTGKPEDTGIRLAQHAGYNFDNLSAPLWVETYLWAGFPMVALVFGLYGALVRRIDDVRQRLRDNHGSLAVLLVPALAFFQLILLRGSLMACMGPLTLLILIPLCVTVRGGYGVREGTRKSLTTPMPVPSRRVALAAPAHVVHRRGDTCGD
jgi:hypothetical protein